MAQEIQSYPKPPNHYLQFASGPTTLQPPDVRGLGPTYRMFGRVVQNPLRIENAQFPPPPIDQDVLLYDPKNPIKSQLIELIDTLAPSVLSLLDAVQNSPADTGAEQRDLDNRIKSIFHALECLRPHEAKQTILRMTEKEIRTREEANEKCREAIARASSLLT
jgi:hypothetical protein